MRTILIATNSHDVHADAVEVRLKARGQNVFRLNLDKFPREFSLAVTVGAKGQSGTLRHLPSGQTLSVDDVGAVWMRKSAEFSFTSENLGAQERAYAKAETGHILFSLLHALDAYWMSHPNSTRAAVWKGEQLQRAAGMGFAVPPSIVTNRRDSLDAFRRALGDEIIFKPLSSPFLGAEDVEADEQVNTGLGTTLITAEHEDLLDAVSELPAFFQLYIPKQYEVRATVIGQRVFAARIDSQADPRTVVDWRDMSAEIPYSVETLPVEIEQRCLDFVHSYGLNFGALDLIVTPAGEYVFLENNPAGQFLFVEELVPELRMLDAVADCLARGAAA